MHSNQISSIGLVSSKDYYKRQSGIIYIEVRGCEFLNGVRRIGGMLCGRGRVMWALLGTGNTSCRPEVALQMHWLSRLAVHFKAEKHEHRIISPLMELIGVGSLSWASWMSEL